MPRCSKLQTCSNNTSIAHESSIFGDRLHTVLDDLQTQVPQVEQWLKEDGVDVQSHREIEFSLEDVFIGVVDQARQRGLDVPVD